MKRINSLVNDSVNEFAEDMSVKEKSNLKNEIIFMSGALLALFCGLIYKAIYPQQDVIVSFIYLAGVIIVGVPIVITAVKGLIKNDNSASMEILVSIAIAACLISDQYVIALLIPVILTFVHFLEEKSIVGGRDAIDALKKIQAHSAILIKNGVEIEVDVKILNVGDTIKVMPGMSVPIDGQIISGISSINQQSLTGESNPVYVKERDKVFAGTINIEGVLTVRVEKSYQDTSFQQIVALMEKTQNITVNETKVIDKFLTYYIPGAIIIAIMVWLFTKDISRAIAILVVSCPCGYMLVNSAPMLSAFSSATKHGIIIKNSNFINTLGDCDCIIFDKTGTITNGTMEAVGYHTSEGTDYEKLINTAVIAASNSLHPVSKSILKLCGQNHYEEGYTVTEYIGKGVSARRKEEVVYLGNKRWFAEMGYKVSDEYDAEGAVTWVAENNNVLGCIVFRDTPREDAKATIESLKSLGISEIVLLTGDNNDNAEKIKTVVGIDTMYSKMMPEEKLAKVRELKKEHKVIVVGDGINDALALKEADVGIAMGAMGSDTAIHSADIALMNNSLSNIPFVIDLARKTKKVVFQNIIIAFASSFLMIILAAVGLVSALLGAGLHNIGALIILLNSGKLLRENKDKNSRILLLEGLNEEEN